VRSRSIGVGLAAFALAAAGSWAAFAQAPAGGSGGGSVMATVGRLTIHRNEFAERFDRARAAYRERVGEAIPEAFVPTFRRTVLEQMIRARLLMLEAERQGRLISEAEAEEELKKSPFFNEGGRFSPLKFDAARRNDPRAFADAVADARLRLSGARLEDRVVREHQPEESKLRTAIERELATATVEVLALPYEDFDGQGGEPTEREVVAAWRAGVARGESAPLAEAGPAIREGLRSERRDVGEDDVLRRAYADMRDELRGPAAAVRYAFFDTASIEIKAPSEADLDRFYRGHLADYSRFDAERGEIRNRPFEEVRDDVRHRWHAERRMIEARAAGERLLAAWERGRRDRGAERAAALFREVPGVAVGQPVDTTRFGAQLGDTLAARDAHPVAGMVAVPGGILAFQIHDRRADVVPPFAAVRERVRAGLAEQREREELEAARALFASDPGAFARDSTIHFSRMLVPLTRALHVPLTRAEVERHHRENIDKYSAPEVMAARHILIVPSEPGAAAEEAARLEAEAVLRRVKAGEDFADLAREVSDDAGTRASGGDLGSFGRGTFHPAFDRAVFELRPGETSDVVRTPEGYHIIRCTAYEPLAALPLVEVYSTVGYDAAMAKSVVMARQRADSLLRLIRTVADAERIAAESDYVIYRNHQAIGTRGGDAEIQSFFSRLDRMRPGEIHPLPVQLRGQGYVIAWLDSITPPRAPSFERVKSEAIAAYRRRTGASALEAKRAELVALEREGWSVDSLAALFGGLRRHETLRAGDPLPGLGGADVLDSLVFGDGRRPALAPGETSGWVALPDGLARVRLVERHPPDPSGMAARLDRERRKALERNLFFYYEALKRDFGVRIRDAELAAITLPPPGEPDTR